MEVDVVFAAMQSTANVLRLLSSTLMMISEPFFESKWLRKHDLDHRTQFHPQYLIHVGSHVNPTSTPRKSEPKTDQATTQQATTQQLPNRKPTKRRRPNKMNPSIVKEQGIIKATKRRWPQHMEKNPDQASQRGVVHPEPNQARQQGVVHPVQNQASQQNQASRHL
jgi:hypothetical protein